MTDIEIEIAVEIGKAIEAIDMPSELAAIIQSCGVLPDEEILALIKAWNAPKQPPVHGLVCKVWQ